MNSQMRLTIAEHDRRIANLIRVAVVEEVGHGAARVRVQDGEWLSGWLPWLEQRAHGEGTWSPPAVGEQVLVFCPGGDPELGVVLSGINSEKHPALSSNTDHSIRRFADGATEFHHAGNSLWQITLPEDGAYRISISGTEISVVDGAVTIAAASIKLEGSVEITGDLKVAGSTDLQSTKIKGITQKGD